MPQQLITGNELSTTLSLTGNTAIGNVSYSGTFTGSTGILNIGSGQIYKDTSGNVGIGTSSPGSKLDVSGTVTASSFSGAGTGLTGTASSLSIGGNAANVTGIVSIANGGTGQSSYAVGDLLYASTTTALSKLADVATGNALISGGVGVAPSWGKIGLTTHVSGTLPVSNGGTGLTTLTAGYIPYGNGTSALNSSANLYYDGTNFGLGTSSPFRLLTLSSAISAEMVLQQSGAKANYRNWRVFSTSGNGTTPANFIIDLLNDAGTATTTNGISIDGTTGIVSTPGGRKIDAGSVPAGTVIQTLWNDLGAGNYSATTGTLTNTGFTVTITPKYATSKIVMWITMGMFFVCDGQFKIARNNSVFSPSLGDSPRASYDWYDDMQPTTVTWMDSPGTTSAITYTIWACATGCGQAWAVGSSSDFDSSWTLMEIAQ